MLLLQNVIDSQKQAVQSAEQSEQQLAALDDWIIELKGKTQDAARDEEAMRSLSSEARKLSKQGQYRYDNSNLSLNCWKNMVQQEIAIVTILLIFTVIIILFIFVFINNSNTENDNNNGN